MVNSDLFSGRMDLYVINLVFYVVVVVLESGESSLFWSSTHDCKISFQAPNWAMRYVLE